MDAQEGCIVYNVQGVIYCSRGHTLFRGGDIFCSGDGWMFRRVVYCSGGNMLLKGVICCSGGL